MNLKDLPKDEGTKDLSEFEVLEEKSLDKDWILRKIRFNKKALAHNTRLHLAKVGLKTSNIFGAETAQFISSKDCDNYFNLIESSVDFERLSECARKLILLIV